MRETIYDEALNPFGEDRTFTKAEAQNKIELALCGAVERQRYRGPLERAAGPRSSVPDGIDSRDSFFKALDDDSFSGVFEKRARVAGSARTALKSSLSDSELAKAREFLRDMPHCLESFEAGYLAVIFRDGEVSGTSF